MCSERLRERLAEALCIRNHGDGRHDHPERLCRETFRGCDQHVGEFFKLFQRTILREVKGGIRVSAEMLVLFDYCKYFFNIIIIY